MVRSKRYVTLKVQKLLVCMCRLEVKLVKKKGSVNTGDVTYHVIRSNTLHTKYWGFTECVKQRDSPQRPGIKAPGSPNQQQI